MPHKRWRSLVGSLPGAWQPRYWEWILARGWSRIEKTIGLEDFNHPEAGV